MVVLRHSNVNRIPQLHAISLALGDAARFRRLSVVWSNPEALATIWFSRSLKRLYSGQNFGELKSLAVKCRSDIGDDQLFYEQHRKQMKE